MGYAVYEDISAPPWVYRWAGYGVPAECDWPKCDEQINRGLAYKCEEHVEYYIDAVTEQEVEQINDGCGRFFCDLHLYLYAEHQGIEHKPDSLEWVRHMLTDESWQQWRDENPSKVAAMKQRLVDET